MRFLYSQEEKSKLCVLDKAKTVSNLSLKIRSSFMSQLCLSFPHWLIQFFLLLLIYPILFTLISTNVMC